MGLRKNYTDNNGNNNNTTNNNTNNTTNNKVQTKTGTPYSNILNPYLFLYLSEGTNKNWDPVIIIWGETPQ